MDFQSHPRLNTPYAKPGTDEERSTTSEIAVFSLRGMIPDNQSSGKEALFLLDGMVDGNALRQLTVLGQGVPPLSLNGPTCAPGGPSGSNASLPAVLQFRTRRIYT